MLNESATPEILRQINKTLPGRQIDQSRWVAAADLAFRAPIWQYDSPTRKHITEYEMEEIWPKRCFDGVQNSVLPLWFPYLLEEDSRKFSDALKKRYELLDRLYGALLGVFLGHLIPPYFVSSRSLEKLMRKILIPKMEKVLERVHSGFLQDLGKYCFSLPTTGIIIHLVCTCPVYRFLLGTSL
jgi:hypothetical protein